MGKTTKSLIVKRLAFIFAGGLVVLALVWIALGPVIAYKAVAQLQRTFPGSNVAIAGVKVRFPDALEANGIIINGNDLKVTVGHAEAEFNIRKLWGGEIEKISVSDVKVAMDTNTKAVNALEEHFHSTGGNRPLKIDAVSLDNIVLDLVAKDLKVDAEFSFAYSFSERKLDRLKATAPVVKGFGLTLKNIWADRGNLDEGALINVGEADLGKAVINGIDGVLRPDLPNVFVDFLIPDAFGGRIKGNGSFYFLDGKKYIVEMDVSDLNIERLVKELELENKFYMNGGLNGGLILEGAGTNLDVLSGDFKTALGGGTLIINDTRLLENVARRTKQPVDIMVENFRNYNYNNGTVKLTLDGKNIILNLLLNGDAGKRELIVTLHDFLKT